MYHILWHAAETCAWSDGGNTLPPLHRLNLGDVFCRSSSRCVFIVPCSIIKCFCPLEVIATCPRQCIAIRAQNASLACRKVSITPCAREHPEHHRCWFISLDESYEQHTSRLVNLCSIILCLGGHAEASSQPTRYICMAGKDVMILLHMQPADSRWLNKTVNIVQGESCWLLHLPQAALQCLSSRPCHMPLMPRSPSSTLRHRRCTGPSILPLTLKT